MIFLPSTSNTFSVALYNRGLMSIDAIPRLNALKWLIRSLNFKNLHGYKRIVQSNIELEYGNIHTCTLLPALCWLSCAYLIKKIYTVHKQIANYNCRNMKFLAMKMKFIFSSVETGHSVHTSDYMSWFEIYWSFWSVTQFVRIESHKIFILTHDASCIFSYISCCMPDIEPDSFEVSSEAPLVIHGSGLCQLCLLNLSW